MKVKLADQVTTFIRALPPQPRRRLRLAIPKLESERGDIKQLEGPLRAYSRLRVGPYRILFTKANDPDDGMCIYCIFAERRDTVYAVFSDIVQQQLLRDR